MGEAPARGQGVERVSGDLFFALVIGMKQTIGNLSEETSLKSKQLHVLSDLPFLAPPIVYVWVRY